MAENQHIGWMSCPSCEQPLHPPTRLDADDNGFFRDGQPERTCDHCKVISWVCIDDVPADKAEHFAYVATDYEKAEAS